MKKLWTASAIAAPLLSIMTPFDLVAVVIAGAVGATARAAWKSENSW